MDAEERAHIEQLIELNQAHLREIEKQQALLGITAPSTLAVQAADYRRQIADLEDRLREGLPRHNLPPRDYEQFIGRQKELAELRRLLQPYPKSRYHLVTIDGIGGIGKSAMALEIAYTLRDGYASMRDAERFDAIVWVSAKRSYLTADGILERRQTFRTLDDLYAAIAQVLDFPAITRACVEDQRTIVERVLSEQRTLLILDNLETVDDEDLLVFLRELPDPTKAIVTTRHRIDVAFPVRLTGMPHEDALTLIQQEAIRKEVDIAPEAQEQLWQRTGGVPLAIVWSIGLMGLGGSVKSVLRRLGSGQSNIARFCFAESVGQIRGRDAHKLLMALALFASDASREAVGIVAGLGQDEFGRDTGLEDLLRLSLVNKDGDRFGLLPLTRSFVQGEVDGMAEWMAGAWERWQEYFFELADIYGGWTLDWGGHDRVEHDLANILAVLDRLVGELHLSESPRETQPLTAELEALGQRLIAFIPKVARVCRLRGYWSDCDRLSLVGVQVCRLMNNAGELGWRYYDLSRISYFRGNIHDAKRWATEAHAVWEQQYEHLVCFADRILGLVALDQGNIEDAERLLTGALQSYGAERVGYASSNFLEAMGYLAETKGDQVAALRWYQQAVEVCRQTDNLPALAGSLHCLGTAVWSSGDIAGARSHYEEALKRARECSRADAIARTRYKLATFDGTQGDRDSAVANARQALDLFRRLGMKREQAKAEALLAKLESQTSIV